MNNQKHLCLFHENEKGFAMFYYSRNGAQEVV